MRSPKPHSSGLFDCVSVSMNSLRSCGPIFRQMRETLSASVSFLEPTARVGVRVSRPLFDLPALLTSA
jgi:hypothetical protein